MKQSAIDQNQRTWLDSIISADSIESMCRAFCFVGLLGSPISGAIFASIDDRGYVCPEVAAGSALGTIEHLPQIHFHKAANVTQAFTAQNAVISDFDEVAKKHGLPGELGSSMVVVPLFDGSAPHGVLFLFTSALLSRDTDPLSIWQLGTIWAWYRYWLLKSRMHAPKASLSDSTTFLTDRQKLIAGVILRGFTNVEIAQNLHLSDATVKSEITKMFRIFKVTRRADLKSALLNSPGSLAS
jgi:DNA-binding CsgD family transcriptional regulator